MLEIHAAPEPLLKDNESYFTSFYGSIRMLTELFTKSETGAIQSWRVGVEKNSDGTADIVTIWGLVDGAKQTARDTIKEGKNAGKKNATTAHEQALKEAQSLWEKKLKKGYVKSIEDARAGKVDAIITGGIEPMLAQKFADYADEIRFPAYAQPKLDGHRCIAIVKDGKATLWSRTRKPITGVPHIARDVETMSQNSGIKDFVLDGELYTHAYREKFEELSSFIRQVTPKAGHEVVQYHVYDAVTEGTYEQRAAFISGLFGDDEEGETPYLSLVKVETRLVNARIEIDSRFSEFMEQGYEGLMVRSADGKYENKRSKNLLKRKDFDDAEFDVKAVEEGRGKLAGKAIFVCEHEGREFRVKMKGTLESLKQYVTDPGLAVGKKLTVRYFGMTNAEQVPRFPVGIRFRPDGE